MIHETAIVETKDIGDGVIIKEHAIIRGNVIIGNNVIIHPHVVIENGVELGNNVEIFPGAYLGKEPKGVGATARLPIFDRKIVIGNGVSIGPNAIIYYDVQIGNNTLIGDGASIREQCKIGAYCIISRYVTINYNTIIGNKTKIMDLSHITGNCIIGDSVFISIGVQTVNDNNIGAKGYNEDFIKGPNIENGVCIGAGAIIFPGVLIGVMSVVASGSIVKKAVKPRTLVAGNPAKVICSLKEE